MCATIHKSSKHKSKRNKNENKKGLLNTKLGVKI